MSRLSTFHVLHFILYNFRVRFSLDEMIYELQDEDYGVGCGSLPVHLKPRDPPYALAHRVENARKVSISLWGYCHKSMQ